MPKAFGLVDWSASAAQIERQVRALSPWPTAYSFLHLSGQAPTRIVLGDVDPVETSSTATPGEVIAHPAGRLVVKAGDGAVAIRQLQPAGKRMMSAEDFTRGRSVPAGALLGPETREP